LAAFKSFFDILDLSPGVATAAAAETVWGILELSFAAVGKGIGAGARSPWPWGVWMSSEWVCCESGDGFVGIEGGVDSGSIIW